MTTTDLAATASAAPKLRLPLTFVCSLIAAATIDGRTRSLTTDAWQVATTRRLQGALPEDPFALLMIDIDDFGKVNNTLPITESIAEFLTGDNPPC